jgi:hypothetical protein
MHPLYMPPTTLEFLTNAAGHFAFAVMDQREPSGFGNAQLARHHDALGKCVVAGVFDIAANGLHRHFVQVRIEIAAHHNRRILVRIEQFIDQYPHFQRLAGLASFRNQKYLSLAKPAFTHPHYVFY